MSLPSEVDSGGKVAWLAIKAIIREAHLGPEEEEVLVGKEDTAFVAHVPMLHSCPRR